jgi:hypothetical protein
MNILFKIAVSDEQLNDLLARLTLTRVPRSLDAESWDDGASLAFMERLIGYWRLGFDWRAQEDRLNRFPQFIARVGELDVHFVHETGKGPRPCHPGLGYDRFGAQGGDIGAGVSM